MPRYPFQAADGRRMECFYPMSEAPPIGSTLVVDGVEYVRQAVIPNAAIVPDTNFTNWTLSRKDAEAMGHKEFDENGCAVFSSKRAVDELVSRSQDTTTPIAHVR